MSGRILSFCYGNMTQQETINIDTKVKEILNIFQSDIEFIYNSREIKLDNNFLY